jgi:hypothetical protein
MNHSSDRGLRVKPAMTGVILKTWRMKEKDNSGKQFYRESDWMLSTFPV